MKTRAVLRHAREVIGAEIEDVRENAADVEASWPNYRAVEYYYNMRRGGGDDVHVFYTSPTPYSWLLKKAFASFDSELKAPIRSDILSYISRALLTRMGGLTDSGYSPVSANLGSGYMDNCIATEGYFIDTLAQIDRPEVKPLPDEWQDQITVYHDRENTPIALRKSNSIRSAMLLRPARIEEAVIPPGTIIRVDPLIDGTQTGGHQTVNGSTWQTYEVDDGSFTMKPLRLSPWAFADVPDRALYGVHGTWIGLGISSLSYNFGRGDLVWPYSIDDFCLAAEKVLQVAQAGYVPAEVSELRV